MYKLWVWVGNYLGFGGKHFKEMDEHRNQLLEEMTPEFERLSFIKDGKYVA